MKRLLLLALTAGLLSPIAGEAFWKYGSMEQAWQGCYKWVRQGKNYKYWAWEVQKYGRTSYYSDDNDYPSGKWVVQEQSKRFCRQENETRQILGKVRKIQNNFVIGVWWTERFKRTEIKKHFRY
tara:strand:+ start:664 stop:1035 length:372 start_codon:yes stop_codon:yes gene_type:complete